MAKISDLDAVALSVDLPEHGLKKGAIGTVVHIFSFPSEAYEVEFCDKDGRTLVQLPLTADQIEKYKP